MSSVDDEVKISGVLCRMVQCSVISPRFDVKMKDLEQWTAYLLPSRQFGYDMMICSRSIVVD